MEIKNLENFSRLVCQAKPEAKAVLRGRGLESRIGGTIHFYAAGKGTLVVAEVVGLPRAVTKQRGQEPAGPFYAFHIHEGKDCGSGDGDDPFQAAGNHFNPGKLPHPLHAGDLPPLMADKGYAYMAVYTSRFTPEEVIGRVAIVHQHPDDFHTQPSGDAGMKIACGRIEAY